VNRTVISLSLTLLLFQVSFAFSQSALWLPPGSRTDAKTRIPELIDKNSAWNRTTILGKLLFNSPSVLGEKAVRIGLSCNSCHPSGHVNTDFYIEGLSDKPGTIDLTNSFWRDGTEDKTFNPVPIPSLRNAKETAPYGTLQILPTLPAFTRHVIVTEFGGPEPDQETLEALVAYMLLLEKETGDNRFIQAQTPSIRATADILSPAIEARDINRFDRNSSLFREELGRRINSKNEVAFKQIVQDLKKLRQTFRDKPEHLEKAFETLLAGLDQ